jgi:hypothetical protein
MSVWRASRARRDYPQRPIAVDAGREAAIGAERSIREIGLAVRIRCMLDEWPVLWAREVSWVFRHLPPPIFTCEDNMCPSQGRDV